MKSFVKTTIVSFMTITIIISVNPCIQSQSSWFISSNGNTIYKIQFLNSSTGYAIIGNAVSKTTNGGHNWNYHQLGFTTISLYGLYFIDENTGWAVGDSSMIGKTTNGGLNWTRQNSPIYCPWNKCYFINSQTGWIAGNFDIIIKTTNSGSTWIQQTSSQVYHSLCVYFLNESTGFRGSGTTMLKSTNGGTSWNFSLDATIRDINFINDNTGWAVGSLHYKTTNGGNNWTISQGVNSWCIYPKDSNYVWSGGAPNLIMSTSTGGLSWGLQNSSVNNANITFFSLSGIDSSGIYNVFISGSYGTMLKTINKGLNWNTLIYTPATAGLNSQKFLNDSTGFVVGNNGTIIQTTNAGRNWFLKNSSTTNILTSVDFASPSTGIIVGYEGKVLRTTNSGNNWVNYPTGLPNDFHKIYFINDLTGWMCGEFTIRKTTNAGENWNSVYTTDLWGYDIFFINENTGWSTFYGGTIIKTTNGGTSWSPLLGQSSITYNAIRFANINTGWAAGTYNTILKTTNGGSNWFQQSSGIFSNSFHFKSIQLNDTSGNFLWVAGTEGVLIRSTNGGQNWTKVPVPFKADLNSINFLNLSTGYITGSNGLVLKTTNGGTVSITESHHSIINGYHLLQNYPNPFNPETVIEYEIPDRESSANYVRIGIYDAVGRQLETLHQKNPSTGKQTLIFNARNYHSGIFFYTLEIDGKIVSTRRMVYLK